MSTPNDGLDTVQSAHRLSLSFGPFKLLPRQRILLDGGKPVRLGSRALDILIALAERAGEIVDKTELISLVWPNTRVDEANVRTHIMALRKILGERRGNIRYISTIAGRGYCFIAEVNRRSDIPVADRVHASQDRSRDMSHLSFGPFKLLPRQRILLDSGTPVLPGSRAVDILLVLAERAGEIVDKNELISLVWPNTSVDEANLRSHILALRKVLGEGPGTIRYISTIPGAGYCFTAEVDRRSDIPVADRGHASQDDRHCAPVSVHRPIGRDAIIDTLVEELRQQRFLSLVGAPGIGKTTVAHAVADVMAAQFDGCVHVVDFSSTSDPASLPTMLSATLGHAAASGTIVDCLTTSLKNERALIVFDHCDHVIGAAADLAEQLLQGAPGVHILAASREALSADGERVHRLGPLGTPPDRVGLTVSDVLAFPSVALFVDRVSARDEGFELRGEDVAIVADICRSLDGNPLAIEVAASQADIFGLRELAALIDDRFLLTVHGHRTACARHRTVEAALDWSYLTLAAVEQSVFQRLALFADDFTMDAAIAVAEPDLDADQVFASIVTLAAKSLVAVVATEPEVTYRLEGMTRAYLVEKIGKRRCEAL